VVLSIQERYSSRDKYMGKIAQAAKTLVDRRYLPLQDVPDLIDFAAEQYDWAKLWENTDKRELKTWLLSPSGRRFARSSLRE
jgi:hypothetical protein